MKIQSLTNIIKKDMPLHYRNEYSGDVLYQNLSGEEECAPIEFVVERSALGSLEISVEFMQSVDYPLLPALKSVKSFISHLDKRGELP